jgi:hypothetical protein
MVTKRDEIFMTNIIMPIKSVFLFKNLTNSSVMIKYLKIPLADLMRLLLNNLFHPMSLDFVGSLGFMLFGVLDWVFGFIYNEFGFSERFLGKVGLRIFDTKPK